MSPVTHLWLQKSHRTLCGATDGATSVDPQNTSCPECQFLRMSDAGNCAPPVLGKTAEQMQGAGWSRSVEEYNEKQGKKRGKRMAKKKANGEAASNGTNADPVKVINCTKTFRVKLSDAEIRERGELAGGKKAQLDALQSELDAHKKEQNGKIDALDAEVGTLLAQIYNGHESRQVKCRQEYVYRTNTVRVVREDTGEEVESRAMLPEELEKHGQVPIQAKGANEETEEPPAEAKPKRARKKRGQAAEQSAEAP